MMKDGQHSEAGQNRSQRSVRFGAFEADLHTQELWKYGARLKLAGQPFQVLEMLLARPGELVSRDELQKRLWPDAPFTDSNHGLNAAVNKLREMLGDSADDPKYIETLPRRGYRFIAAIEVEDYLQAVEQPVATKSPELPAAVLPATVAPIQAPVVKIQPPVALVQASLSGRQAIRWLSLAASVGIVLCALGVVAFVGKSLQSWQLEKTEVSPEGPPQFARVIAAPQVDAADMELQEPPRKDERQTGIIAEQKPFVPVPAVYRTAGTMEPTMRTIISGDGGAAAPQISPDGKHIAFMSNRTGPWQIWVSNADGSNPMQISFTDSAGTPRWSPDGRYIAFDGPGDQGSSIFVARADGSGRTIQVTEGLVPSYSRDGQWIYFASERSGDWQVWKVLTAGGSALQVTHEGGFAALEGLDGYLYYAKSRYPSPEVWRTPLAGGDEELVSEHLRPRTWSSWTVTRTGILFVEDVRNGKATLSLYDPASRVVRDVAPLQTAPFWMAATSDGKRAIMNDSGERQITMMENIQ